MLRGKASASRFVRDADAAPPRTRLKLRYEDDDAETETEDHLEEEEDVDEDATEDATTDDEDDGRVRANPRGFRSEPRAGRTRPGSSWWRW